jgi:hypothetical protein
LFSAVALIFVETIQPLPCWAADSAVSSASSVVQVKLLDPLQKKEASRSHFSRAAMPPMARRVRILDTAAQRDTKGRSFVQFAIDESRGLVLANEKQGSDANWFKNVITGCVYPETGEVLIKRGEVYLTSSVLLGQPSSAASTDVCRSR